MKTKILLAALLLTILSFSNYGQGTWNRKADVDGEGRAGAVGFSIGEKGYIGTGANGGVIYFRDFWEYDAYSNVWTQKADFGGGERAFATAFSIGKKGYIGTGSSVDDSSSLSVDHKDFWEYDPANNSWTQKTNFGGSARSGAIGFNVGSKGYLGIGGPNDLWEYNPATDSWTKKADFPDIGLLEATAFNIGAKGYVGTGSKNGSSVKDFWEYDPLADTWARKADFAGTACKSAVGFSIGNKGYLGTGLGYSPQFWQYDPDTDAWKQKADYTAGPYSSSKAILVVFDAVGFSIGNKGYIGTGYGNYGFLNDFHEYTPDDIVVCNPPSNLLVLNTTDSSSKLGWTLPTSSIVGMIIHYHPAGTSVWKERLVRPGKSYVTINKLLPGTTYKWKIRSVCADKISLWVKGPDFITVPAFALSSIGTSDAFNIEAAKTCVQVMPNPGNGNFTLQLRLPDKPASTTLALYNSDGKKVWQQNAGIVNGNIYRNIAHVNKPSAGIYLLVIERSDSKMVHKIVINQ